MHKYYIPDCCGTVMGGRLDWERRRTGRDGRRRAQIQSADMQGHAGHGLALSAESPGVYAASLRQRCLFLVQNYR